MIANSLNKLGYANLPNLLDLIENLSFCTSQIEKCHQILFSKLIGGHSPFLHYRLVSSFQKFWLPVFTCISNIDFLKAGNQPIMQKW